MSEKLTPELSSSLSDEWTLIDASEAEMEDAGNQMYSDDIGMSLMEGVQDDFMEDPTKKQDAQEEGDLSTSSPNPEMEALINELNILNKKLRDQSVVIELQDKQTEAFSRKLSMKQQELEEVEEKYSEELEELEQKHSEELDKMEQKHSEELAMLGLEKDQIFSEKRDALAKIDDLENRLKEERKLAIRMASLKDQGQESLDMAQSFQGQLERRITHLRSGLISSILQVKECVGIVEEEINESAVALELEDRSRSRSRRRVDDLEGEEDLSSKGDRELEDLSHHLIGQLMNGMDLLQTELREMKEKERQMKEKEERDAGRKKGRRGRRRTGDEDDEDDEDDEEKGDGRRRRNRGRSGRKEREEGEGNDDVSNLKISTRDFESGDVMIFFPLYNNYVAFNISCPHHYLSHDSKSMIGSHPLFKKAFIVGRLVLKETYTASSDFNPFNLRDGCEFSIVTVTTL